MTPHDKQMLAIKTALDALTADYDTLLSELQSRDYIMENEKLQAELNAVQHKLLQLEKECTHVRRDNSRLRTALREQMLDEKLNLIKVSRQKLNTYFASEAGAAEHALKRLDSQIRGKLKQLRHSAEKNLVLDDAELQQQFDSLSRLLREKTEQRKRELEQQRKLIYDAARDRLEQLAAEGVDEQQLQARVKQNELEMKIGLNWLNKIGIILILFGVGAAFRYTYSIWFTDYMKGIVFYLLGVGLLAAGEWFYRQEKKTFSTGLLSGGIAVLYSSTFFSYFLLGIINQYTAVLFCLLVSLTAVLLSVRYDSKTVCTLGLLGGYFPFYSYIASYGFLSMNYYAAMGYLLALNLVILLVSFSKRWNLVNYISFALHLPSFIIIAFYNSRHLSSMIYTALLFVLYLAVTLAYPLRHKLSLKIADVILLGLNTFFCYLILFALFDASRWHSFQGALALVFAVTYILLARFTEKTTNERATVALFYLTSLTFAVLMVPLQFGMQWLTLGWLVEGLLLILYGYKKGLRPMEKAGWIIFALCLAVFFRTEFPAIQSSHMYVAHFHAKYFAVSMGLLLVLLAYLLPKEDKPGILGDYLIHYKYLVLANLWFYLVYTAQAAHSSFVPAHSLHYFYHILIFSFVTFFLAAACSRITLLADQAMPVFCSLLYTMGCIAVLFINVTVPVLRTDQMPGAAHYSALAALIAYNLLVLIAARQAILAAVRQHFLSLELYPLFMGIWLLGNITAFLIVQFNLSTANLLFSVIYVLLSAAFVIYGLRRHYIYIRRFGLGLALFATAKLFIYDLSYLTSLSKIFAYFCFGIILVAMSYIYQKLEKGWEGKRIAEKS